MVKLLRILGISFLIIFSFYFSLFFGTSVIKERIVCKFGSFTQYYICQSDPVNDLRIVDILIYSVPLFVILCIGICFMFRKIIPKS